MSPASPKAVEKGFYGLVGTLDPEELRLWYKGTDRAQKSLEENRGTILNPR